MAYTPYTSELVLSHLFSATAVTRPTAWEVGLFDGDPEAGGVELTDASYVRQSVTFTVADSDSNGRFEAANDAVVTFPGLAAPASVAYVVVFDQLANQLTSLPLNIPRSLEAGDVFSIPAGELVIKGENP